MQLFDTLELRVNEVRKHVLLALARLMFTFFFKL